MSDVTRILQSTDSGDSKAAERLLPLVYNELRRLAAAKMAHENAAQTLQPTALVHEAYCRLVDQSRVGWQNRAHFFGIAARAMREILVDHARRRAAAKRGGNRQRVTLIDGLGVAPAAEIEVLELDEALTRLAEMHQRMARVVELRVFVGMKEREVAHVLGVSERTVRGDWRVAKLWLSQELAQGNAQ